MPPLINRISDIQKHIETIERSCAKDFNIGSNDHRVSMLNLFYEAIREAKRLQNAKDDIQSISAAVRNIFEIHLIIKYLENSEDAVKRWIGQLQNDALEIHDGVISLISKHGFNSEALVTSKARVVESGEKHGVVPSKPFRIREIANEFGWVVAYDAMYKLCSKIIHPSSIRVNLPGVFDDNDDYINTDSCWHTSHCVNCRAFKKRIHLITSTASSIQSIKPDALTASLLVPLTTVQSYIIRLIL